MEEIQPIDAVHQGYVPPLIVDYGDLVDLTAGASTGSHQDATFPTPTSHVTFSG